MNVLNLPTDCCSPHHYSLPLVLTFTVLLSACGTKYSSSSRNQTPTSRTPVVIPDNPVTQPEPPPEPPAPQVIRPTTMTPPADPVRSLPAALALRDQADTAAQTGNHSRAIGLLERAIRISPQDPSTFQALAENHLALNRPGQALQLVRRGLSLNPTASQRESLEQLAAQCQALL